MSTFHSRVELNRIKKSKDLIYSRIFTDRVPFEAEVSVTREPVPYSERLQLKYSEIKPGEKWGDAWDCGWFHVKGTVPKTWKGSPVVLNLNVGGEGLVFNADGCPAYAISNCSVFSWSFSKSRMHFLEECKGGEKLDFWIDAGANAIFFGVDQDEHFTEKYRDGKYEARVASLEICKFDYEAWHLWIELDVIMDLALNLPESSARRQKLLIQSNKALDVYFVEGAAAARALLKELFAVKSDPGMIDITATGHAHIDVAWLWPIRETIRKAARTFSSQIRNIERFDGYVFGASQPQLYAFVKEHYPKLYAKIKKAVADGRWELQGGMWVEPDCNIPSGESLVRQILFGKNFFMDEFGADIKNLWLPDVFGYSANLPQILNKAGIDYFLTQKLSWSKYTTFEHTTFWWEGIGGGRVLAHFPPENSYNSSIMPSEMIRSEKNNKDAGITGESVSLFGIGDGGGGPTDEMIERTRLLHDTSGTPRVNLGPTQPALERMAKIGGDDLATWKGELYLEVHRGTYTTQAAMKYWHRRCEEAFRSAEMLCTAAGSDTYPSAEFERLWKNFLTMEFHDVIPGSSIARVYREAIPLLKSIIEECTTLSRKAAAKLMEKNSSAITLFNPASTVFRGLVHLPDGWNAATSDFGEIPTQLEPEGRMAAVEIKPRSFLTLVKSDNCSESQKENDKILFSGVPLYKSSKKQIGKTTYVLKNDFVEYAFDETMHLVSAVDAELGIDFIPDGDAANRIEMFDDHPADFDAWDIDEFATNSKIADPEVLSITALPGTLRSGLRATMKIGDSNITQTVWLENTSKRLDFVTEADWHESHKLLRVAFPTVIDSSKASFEIQYAVLQRATTNNNMAEHAQFEVVGHRFADLSERKIGAALLNNCKYGYKVKGSELSMSLLRSPKHPDNTADMGQHKFTYSFLPHAGDLQSSNVREQAAIINQGATILEGFAASHDLALPVDVTGDGIEMQVLKKAEKSSDLIVRVVETDGARTSGVIKAEGRSIIESDLMEWNNIGRARKNSMAFDLAPFEIKTFRLS